MPCYESGFLQQPAPICKQSLTKKHRRCKSTYSDQIGQGAYVLHVAEKEHGHNITKLTDDEVQVWVEACKDLHEEVIQRHEASGKPAREVYNRMVELIASY